MPRAFKLTQRTVETATCPPGKKDILVFDSETRGFGLRVTAVGTKTFIAQYRAATGNRRVRLGTFGALTVEEARKEAKGVLGAAAKGGDPFMERKARDQADRRAKASAEFTFARLVDAWAEAPAGRRLGRSKEGRPTPVLHQRSRRLPETEPARMAGPPGGGDHGGRSRRRLR